MRQGHCEPRRPAGRLVGGRVTAGQKRLDRGPPAHGAWRPCVSVGGTLLVTLRTRCAGAVSELIQFEVLSYCRCHSVTVVVWQGAPCGHQHCLSVATSLGRSCCCRCGLVRFKSCHRPECGLVNEPGMRRAKFSAGCLTTPDWLVSGEGLHGPR